MPNPEKISDDSNTRRGSSLDGSAGIQRMSGWDQPIYLDKHSVTNRQASKLMNKFRKLGLISYNGNIEVHSSLMDAVLREKPGLEEDE
jgi:hypothetical protein